MLTRQNLIEGFKLELEMELLYCFLVKGTALLLWIELYNFF